MYDRLYAIYDVVAGHFAGPVFCCPNNAAAARSFGDIVRSPGSQVNQYPSDFVLLDLGVFVRSLSGGLAIDAVVDPGASPVVRAIDFVSVDELARRDGQSVVDALQLPVFDTESDVVSWAHDNGVLKR